MSGLPAEARDSRSCSCGLGRSRSDRKSTRLNSSHSQISYAVFCLKKKKKTNDLHKPSNDALVYTLRPIAYSASTRLRVLLHHDTTSTALLLQDIHTSDACTTLDW